MHHLPRTGRALAAALAITAAVGATAATAHEGHHETQSVTLRFAAVNGTQPVSCGVPITGLGTTSTTAQLQDLRFYVSNVRLVRKNGTTVPLTLGKNNAFNLTSKAGRVTLIDLENGTGACDGDAAMNKVVKGTVPHGDYVGARFYVGVPWQENHTDTVGAPAPLDITAMTWSWQSGRKFSKIEVTQPSPGAWKAPSFFVHIGSTGCTGNPATGQTAACTDSNRQAVRFAKMNPATQTILVDLRNLFAGNDITVNRAGAPGCMSGPTDPECGPVFAALGIDWQPNGTGTGQPIDNGATQTLFRLKGK